MLLIDFNQNNLLKVVADVFEHGGVVVFPTDTVYGVGCLPNEKNLQKLYKAKNRQNQPTAVLINKKILSTFIDRLEIPAEIFESFLEGKTTLIVEQNKTPFKFPATMLKDETLGIRMPNFEFLEKLIDKVGPIAATSANFAGENTPQNFAQLDEKFLQNIDLTIKYDGELSGTASKIYSLITNQYLR